MSNRAIVAAGHNEVALLAINWPLIKHANWQLAYAFCGAYSVLAGNEYDAGTNGYGLELWKSLKTEEIPALDEFFAQEVAKMGYLKRLFTSRKESQSHLIAYKKHRDFLIEWGVDFIPLLQSLIRQVDWTAFYIICGTSSQPNPKAEYWASYARHA